MQKILVIADAAETCCATPRGLELAALFGIDVDVVAFAYTPLRALELNAAKEAAVRKRLLAEREHSMQAQIDKYQRKGQKVRLKTVWEKNIDQWVIKRCSSDKYIGVIKSGSGTGSLVHTSIDWLLLRKCPIPVLLVAKKRWHRTKPVLVALDLGTTVKSKQTLNSKILGVSRTLSEALGVELKIISAIEIPTLLADLDLVDPIAYVKEEKAKMQPQIAKLAAAHDMPEEAFHCKHGPTEKVITSYAANVRAQIVVMGTVARRGVKARLLGNTAERVLQHMKTDVLAIKP
ncbi:MAG: universal stress protein UspE [Halioglobus sp.]